MSTTSLKKSFFGAIVCALVFSGCSQSDSKGAGASGLSDDKLTQISQSQAAVGQFSSDVKSSKQNTTNSVVENEMTQMLINSIASKEIENTTSSNVSNSQLAVQQKADRMKQRLKSSNCQTQFKVLPKKSKVNVDTFVLEIFGSTCPFRLKYSIASDAGASSEKSMKGAFFLEYESLTDDMAKETDIRKMASKADFDVMSDFSEQTKLNIFKMNVKYSTIGESVSLGAYSVSMNGKMDNILSFSRLEPNPGSGNAATPNPAEMYKKVSIELAYQVAIGLESTSLYGRLEVKDGQEVTHITQINGADVTDEKFNQISSELSIPGFNPASSNAVLNN